MQTHANTKTSSKCLHYVTTQVTKVQVLCVDIIWLTGGRSKNRAVIMRRKMGKSPWGPLETLGASAFPDADHCKVHTNMYTHTHINAHTRALALSRSRVLSRVLAISNSHALTFSRSRALTLSCSCALTFSHTHMHGHIHYTYTHTSS